MQTFDDMLSFDPYEHARRSSEPDSPVEVVSALAQVIEWEHRSMLFDELYAREDTFRGDAARLRPLGARRLRLPHRTRT